MQGIAVAKIPLARGQKECEHIAVLDGVRGLAVLLVILVHFVQLFPERSQSISYRLALWGQTGVDLFFVLSGFLITGVLLRAKGSERAISDFFVRRVFRIFPLYYLTLVGFYFVWPAVGLSSWTAGSHSVWYWLDVQDLAIAFAPGLQHGPEHFWSLAVEEHFYLVWPFAVMWLDKRRLYWVAGSAVAISLICRLMLAQFDVYFFTLSRLDGLAVGAALAIYLSDSREEAIGRLVPWAKRVFAFLGVALLVQLVMPRVHLPVVHVVRDTLISVVYACGILLLMGRQGGLLGWVLSGRVMGSVGKFSYAMYVLHPFLFLWLKSLGIGYGFGWLGLCVGMSWVSGWVSWLVLEQPILQLRRRWETRVRVVSGRTGVPASVGSVA